MQVKSNALQWVLVYCIIGLVTPILRRLSIQYYIVFCIRRLKKCFFLYVLSLKFHRELVAGWLALRW